MDIWHLDVYVTNDRHLASPLNESLTENLRVIIIFFPAYVG